MLDGAAGRPKQVRQRIGGDVGAGQQQTFLARFGREGLAQGLRGVLRRHEVGLEEVLPQHAGRRGPDGGDADTGQGAGVHAQRSQALDQARRPVGRREDQPVELPQAPQRRVDDGPVLGRANLDGGALDDVRPEEGEPLGQPGSLPPRSRHEDPLPPERQLLQPGDPLAEADHLADDDECGGFDVRLGGGVRGRRQRGLDGPLVRPGRVLDDGDGRLLAPSGGEEPLGNRRQVAHAHVEDERVDAGQGVVVDGRLALGGVLVAGDERDGRGASPVGQGDAGVAAGGDGRRHAGDDAEGDAGGRQGVGLLAAAAEDQRVPALEPDHDLPGSALLDKQGADLLLAKPRGPGALADVDPLGARRGQRQQLRRRQPVVKNHIRLR